MDTIATVFRWLWRITKWSLVTLITILLMSVGTLKYAETLGYRKVDLPAATFYNDDEIVQVEGTLIGVEEPLANPFNTVEINCYKQSGKCSFLQAKTILNRYLDLYQTELTITQWSDNMVIATADDAICVRYVYMFNLIAGEVSAVRTKRANTSDERCEAATEIMHLRIVDPTGLKPIRIGGTSLAH